MRKIPQKLLCTCAMAVVMGTVAAVLPLQAQGGFQGNVTSAVGLHGNNPFISRGESDVINLYDRETIIDWQPYDNDFNSSAPVDFLPQDNSATFQIGVSAQITDYTVLNRINSSNSNRALALNGLIQSYLTDTNTPGGSVWFYNPGGIVVGATAVFNVGSLLLTSNQIDTTGGLYGPNNEIRFRGPSNVIRSVTIDSGAQINAMATNSYIALVAPRVVQGGTLNVNGSTAYVGAEQADVIINGGLFDINVLVGTTDPNGVVHTGTTTGPASVNAADAQRIAMVAVPKNNALTMLLSGSIGYPVAASVTEENSTVVLSAGFNVDNNGVANSASSQAANMTLGGGTFQSGTYARATGALTVDPTLSSSIAFGSFADLKAGGTLLLNADAGHSISVQGDLTLDSLHANGPGTINVTAQGTPGQVGTIDVTGTLDVNLSNQGVDDAADGGSVVGGTLLVESTGGLIGAQSLVVDATTFSGVGANSTGNATGGTVDLKVVSGGTLQFGTTEIDASAAVNRVLSTSPVTGGDATGGTIRFTGQGGTLDLGIVTAKAQASAGTSTTGVAGDATSGNIVIDLSSGTHDWTSFNGDVTTAGGYSATGSGQFGAAGPGTDGIVLNVSGSATLNIAQSVSLYADTNNGGGGAGGGPSRAGSIDVEARDGGTITIVQDLYAQANAFSSRNFLTPVPEVTPDSYGGSITVGGLGGSFSAAQLYANANAFSAEASRTAGSANGGDVTVFAQASGSLRGSMTLTGCGSFNCSVSADAGASSGLVGATGTGGNVTLHSSDADLSLTGSLSFSAQGRGGESDLGGTGGDGIGGLISVESRRGALNSGILTLGNFAADASGRPTEFSEVFSYNSADGGAGTGGTARLLLEGGTFTADSIALTATGAGAASAQNCPTCNGGGTTPFQAGAGNGGTVSLLLDGANATIGTLTLTASGTGGEAEGSFSTDGVSAIAGSGRGGTASLEAVSGRLTVDTLSITANGVGGKGSEMLDATGADGGASSGGTAQFTMDIGSSATIDVATLFEMSANGTGGGGGSTNISDTPGPFRAGAGGNGAGGTLAFLLDGGILNVPSLALAAEGIGGAGANNGTGGDGGSAGSGTGGTARLTFASEGHNIGSIALAATGQGGVAGASRRLVGFDQNYEPIYASGTGAGGNGGAGTGGLATFALDVDPVFTDLTIDASGTGTAGGGGAVGGTGGAGFGGTNGAGATLAVNFGTLTVTNQLSLLSDGTGGVGGTGATGRGGDGGVGTGGEAGLTVSGGSALVQTNILRVSANGAGGNGGLGGVQGSGGLPGANGGAATGGAAGILVADSAVLSLGGDSIVRAMALGGTGAVGTGSTVPGNGGSGGAGGNATGGRARFAVENAAVTDIVDGSVLIGADATGGAGASGLPDGGLGGRGGNASGGLAEFAGASGAIELSLLSIEARGFGGTSGAGTIGTIGSDAQGGTASVDFFDFVGTLLPASGMATVASLTVNADALAGNGGAGTVGAGGVGGAGGNAIGGTAALGVDGSGIVTQFDAFSASASAFGGSAGTTGGSGTAGAAGGSATGGRVAFSATGGSQTTLGSSIVLLADATGGSGGKGADGPTGGAGGEGGVAIGGDAGFTIDSAQLRSSSSGLYELSASGIGGSGGAGGNAIGAGAIGGQGGAGSNGAGGVANFDALNGDFDLPAMQLLANGTAGNGGIGGSGASQPTLGQSGTATGGTVRVANGGSGALAANGLRRIAELALAANGNDFTANGLAAGTTAGHITLSDTSSAPGGGLVVNGILTADALGTASCACSGIVISSAANPILTGDAFLFSDGPVSFAFDGGGSFQSSGLLEAHSGSTITVKHSNRLSSANSLSGNSVFLSATGDVLAGAGTALRSTGATRISSQTGLVELDRLFAGTTIDLLSETSSVDVGEATAGDTLSATAGTGMIVNFLNSTGGDIVLTAMAGTVSGGELIGNAITVDGAQGIGFSRIASGGTTNLTAANGEIGLADLASQGLVTARGRAVDISGAGTLNFADAVATAGNLAITAGTLVLGTGTASADMTLTSTTRTLQATTLSGRAIAVNSAGDMDLGAATATGALQITAQGTARFAGPVTAPTIVVASGDIVIGSGARLGAQGATRNLTLRASFGQGRNYIGGGEQAGAYSLSGDEMTRLFAQDMLIAPGAQSTIGSFTLTSGANGNLGADGVLTIDSAGRLEVVGAVRLTGLGQQGGLTLRSGNGMDVFTDTGSIALLGSGTTLGGVLTMEGASVAVATRSAIDDITGFIPVDTRSERLSRNDGNVNDDGFLRAGAIGINALGVYIQNSGTGTEFADRRGFTANSLTLSGGGPDAEIIINGRLVNGNGASIGGLETITLISINGVQGGRAGDFSDRSTINGCLILGVANCAIVPPEPPIEIPPVMADNRDAIERVLDPTIAVKQIFPVAIVELRDFVAEGYPPLIDEPVTGAGNEDLWDSDCSVSGDEGCGDPVAQ